jgi:glycosyltransferase involved in cell wall biosynthesis
MRIVIAGQTYYPGNNGQAIFTIHLAEGLARAGHQVQVIVPWGQFHTGSQTIHGVKVHTLRSLNFGWIHPDVWMPFFPSAEVRRIFNDEKPDIVHIQDHYFVSQSVAATARQLGLPVIGTNHFLPENLLPYLSRLPVPRQVKVNVLWGMMLSVYNRLQAITTPTQTAANILLNQKVRPPVTAVSCGVDIDFFHPDPGLDRGAACAQFGLDPRRVLFLYVGRLDGEKRIDLLLRAVARLKEQGRQDIQLAVAGQGAAGGALRELAQTLDLAGQVRFLGYVPNADLPRLYQTGQIFAMPSPEELQSIATLEAMASGLPVLAANARALPELVTPGVNGALFEPNQVEAVAAGMAALIDQREAWERMGGASRARAVEHSLQNTIRRYE